MGGRKQLNFEELRVTLSKAVAAVELCGIFSLWYDFQLSRSALVVVLAGSILALRTEFNTRTV